MAAYIVDWLNLLLRWGHLITGIAWIGSSFYFIWLDNSLEEPSPENRQKGIGGQISSIHGGGFYEVAKYTLAPAAMPANLHWFKWEAYTTWITGFFLLVLMFYLGAQTYLIDPSKVPLSPWQAIAISLLTLTCGWLVYDSLCKSPLAKSPWLLAIILLLFIALLAWALGLVFSDRAAYIHVGALIGSCMAANVFFVIIPGQRALVVAVQRGEKPDVKYARASKLRSVHNNYLTLPILFLMISNHYPMTYGHDQAWAVLVAIIMISAWARHFFNLRHRGITKPSILVSALVALMILAAMIAPPSIYRAKPVAEVGVSTAIALSIVLQRCTSCHSEQPTDDVFTIAPAGVVLQNEAQLRQWAPRILARVVQSRDMPFINKTQMTDGERERLGQWLRQQP